MLHFLTALLTVIIFLIVGIALKQRLFWLAITSILLSEVLMNHPTVNREIAGNIRFFAVSGLIYYVVLWLGLRMSPSPLGRKISGQSLREMLFTVLNQRRQSCSIRHTVDSGKQIDKSRKSSISVNRHDSFDNQSPDGVYDDN